MRQPRAELEEAVRRLPGRTRAAMLEALSHDPIIAGAYTDGRGGVCPLLGAHRRGGRAVAQSFAEAWDLFTGAVRGPSNPTHQDLDELRAMLRDSFAGDEFRVYRPGAPVTDPAFGTLADMDRLTERVASEPAPPEPRRARPRPAPRILELPPPPRDEPAPAPAQPPLERDQRDAFERFTSRRRVRAFVRLLNESGAVRRPAEAQPSA